MIACASGVSRREVFMPGQLSPACRGRTQGTVMAIADASERQEGLPVKTASREQSVRHLLTSYLARVVQQGAPNREAGLQRASEIFDKLEWFGWRYRSRREEAETADDILGGLRLPDGTRLFTFEGGNYATVGPSIPTELVATTLARHACQMLTAHRSAIAALETTLATVTAERDQLLACRTVKTILRDSKGQISQVIEERVIEEQEAS